jgi:hypothetical protein
MSNVEINELRAFLEKQLRDVLLSNTHLMKNYISFDFFHSFLYNETYCVMRVEKGVFSDYNDAMNEILKKYDALFFTASFHSNADNEVNEYSTIEFYYTYALKQKLCEWNEKQYSNERY